MSRHSEIADCIKEQVETVYTDPYTNVRIEDFLASSLPSFGIIISPESIVERPGTVERDDFVYQTIVARIVGSLHNEDLGNRTTFIDSMRTLFHRKKLPCLDLVDCQLYNTIEVGKVAIPNAWETKNNSIVIVRVNTFIRESR